jgi:hypothetical protein
MRIMAMRELVVYSPVIKYYGRQADDGTAQFHYIICDPNSKSK